jgi:heme exporter protein C
MKLLRTGRWITAIALVLLAAVFVRAIEFTPVERVQGLAQKIYYMHVPSAWSAMLAMGLIGVAGLLYLLTKDPRYDRFGEASAEVGVCFSLIMLTTGPLWAKPIWGTWWTWDARLTLTLFMFLLFIGYLVMRGAVTDPGLRARYSAVLGICGIPLLVFIHMSVYLFRTLHPQPIVLKPSRPSLPGSMLATLLISFGVFTLLYVGFVMQRYAIGSMREQKEVLGGGANA